MKREEIRQELVDHYLDFYYQAYSMLNDDDDARDTVQEALASTMAHPLLKNPMGYCHKVIVHTAIDIIRRRRRITPLASNDVADEPHDDEAEASYATLLDRVVRARDMLPQAMKDLVVLHYEKGLNHNELANLTGMSVMTIRRQLKKAQTIMRDKMTEKKGDTQ